MEMLFVLYYTVLICPGWQSGSIHSLLIAFVHSFLNKRNLLMHAWLVDMVYIILPNYYNCVA